MWYLLGTRGSSKTLSCSFFLAFPAERPYGEELVPAGHATKRGNSEEPRDERCLARNMLRCNPLQFQVAANSAVGVQQVPKRSAAPTKSRFARFAAPGQNAAYAQQIVNDCPAPGAPEFRTATRWTSKFGRLDLRSPRNVWTLKHGKKQTLCQARYNENPKE